MAESQGDNQRSFDTSMSGEEGDTVRILPDDSYEPEQERTTIQRGTLYTPAAQSQRTFEPYDAQPAQSASRTRATPHQAAPDESPHTSEREYRPNQPTVVQVQRGPSACAIIAGTLSLLSLACALLAFATFQNGLDKLGGVGGGFFPDFSLVTTPTVTIDTSRPVIIEQIRALSKLETVHYEMQKVVSGASTGPLLDFLTDDKILLVAQGEVVAGIDLGKLESGDITVEGDMVTVRLPDAEILYSKIDNDKTYVYERQTNIFRKLAPDPNLETQVRQAAEKEILQSAIEDGILTKARTNAEQVLRTLITGLGYEEIIFSDE